MHTGDGKCADGDAFTGLACLGDTTAAQVCGDVVGHAGVHVFVGEHQIACHRFGHWSAEPELLLRRAGISI